MCVGVPGEGWGGVWGERGWVVPAWSHPRRASRQLPARGLTQKRGGRLSGGVSTPSLPQKAQVEARDVTPGGLDTQSEGETKRSDGTRARGAWGREEHLIRFRLSWLPLNQEERGGEGPWPRAPGPRKALPCQKRWGGGQAFKRERRRSSSAGPRGKKDDVKG